MNALAAEMIAARDGVIARRDLMTQTLVWLEANVKHREFELKRVFTEERVPRCIRFGTNPARRPVPLPYYHCKPRALSFAGLGTVELLDSRDHWVLAHASSSGEASRWCLFPKADSNVAMFPVDRLLLVAILRVVWDERVHPPRNKSSVVLYDVARRHLGRLLGPFELAATSVDAIGDRAENALLLRLGRRESRVVHRGRLLPPRLGAAAAPHPRLPLVLDPRGLRGPRVLRLPSTRVRRRFAVAV
jgi:hypothetical protein